MPLPALATWYEAIEHIGTGDGGLWGLYAEFLDEAAALLGDDGSGLKTAADHYRALHERWQALAQACLPDHVELFKSTKEMLDRREAIILKQDSDGLLAIAPINDALHELRCNCSHSSGSGALEPILARDRAQVWTHSPSLEVSCSRSLGIRWAALLFRR